LVDTLNNPNSDTVPTTLSVVSYLSSYYPNKSYVDNKIIDALTSGTVDLDRICYKYIC
jgi:hypothetical protein